MTKKSFIEPQWAKIPLAKLLQSLSSVPKLLGLLRSCLSKIKPNLLESVSQGIHLIFFSCPKAHPEITSWSH